MSFCCEERNRHGTNTNWKVIRVNREKKVKIQGWLQKLRDQKRMQFLIVRDRTGLVQVVLEKEPNPETAELISSLGTESALTITGLVVGNAVVKLGGVEIQLESIQVENNAEIPLAF